MIAFLNKHNTAINVMAIVISLIALANSSGLFSQG